MIRRGALLDTTTIYHPIRPSVVREAPGEKREVAHQRYGEIEQALSVRPACRRDSIDDADHASVRGAYHMCRNAASWRAVCDLVNRPCTFNDATDAATMTDEQFPTLCEANWARPLRAVWKNQQATISSSICGSSRRKRNQPVGSVAIRGILPPRRLQAPRSHCASVAGVAGRGGDAQEHG